MVPGKDFRRRQPNRHSGLLRRPAAQLVEWKARCVDSRPIPAVGLERSFAAVIPAVERIDRDAARRGARGPTWFEAVTAAAFDHFARERVDVAVLETGLGGRLDATTA